MRFPSFYRYAKNVLPRDWWRYCRGVYSSFNEARDAIPKGRRVGHLQRGNADIHVSDTVRPSDYSTMFWLSRLLPACRSVFDLGGNVGGAFYSFQKYLSFPRNLRWLVCDVAPVVSSGRKLADNRRAQGLEFTESFGDADGFEIVHTAGALQYLPEELGESLKSLQINPHHILINRVPMTDADSYYTIQDIGSCHCPYRIANRVQFIDSIISSGYELVDEWRCPESWCAIRLKPSRRVDAYSGFYFHHKGG